MGIALLFAALPMTNALADCPASPGGANDLLISFLQANTTQAAPASLYTSTVKEGMLVYDDTDDALKVCDGSNWIEVGSGGGGGGSSSGTAGYVQLSDGAGAFTNSGTTAGQELFWDNTNKRLGIGTATPITALDIVGVPLAQRSFAVYYARDTDAATVDDIGGQFAFQDLAGNIGQAFAVSGGNLRLVQPSTTKLIEFWTNGSAKMVVTPNGTVGIGVYTPNASALLDLSSTNRGFLPPRMTTTDRDAIASPAAGLVVYNSTTNALNIYNGSSWSAVDSGASGGGTGPYLRLSYGANTLTRGNIIPFAAAETGGGAAWSSNRYTVATPGVYFLSISGYSYGTHTIILDILKNGSSILTSVGDVTQTNKYGGAAGSTVAYLNAGDYIEFYYNHDSAGITLTAAYAGISMMGGIGGGGGSSTLAGLTDVNVSSPTDGQSLVYNTTSSKWEPVTITPNGTQVAFSAHNNGTNITVTTNAFTKLNWSTEAFDTNNNFDLTADRFTPTVAGKYIVTLQAYMPTCSAGSNVAIFKNGASVSFGDMVDTGGRSGMAYIVDMNGSSDYLEAWGYCGGGTTIGGDLNQTSFTASLLGGGGGGGSGTPGGADTHVQFNDGGAFGGDPGLVWDNTNKRLGIGTATPVWPFVVVKGDKTTGNSAIGGFTTAEATQPLGLVIKAMGGATSADRGIVLVPTEVGVGSNFLRIGDVGLPYFQVNANGNVGIGTATFPTSTTTAGRTYVSIKGASEAGVLELTNGAADADGINVGVVQFSHAETGSSHRTAYIQSLLSGATAGNRGGVLTLGTKADGGNLLERMRIDAAGNVGVGTAAPSSLLHLHGASASAPTDANTLRISNTANSNFSYIASDPNGFTRIAGNAGVGLGYHNGAAYTEVARVNSAGNVGIGTATPAATALLDVTSTTKGFLPPRMTTAQRDAISSPAQGLTIYNTDKGTTDVFTTAQGFSTSHWETNGGNLRALGRGTSGDYNTILGDGPGGVWWMDGPGSTNGPTGTNTGVLLEFDPLYYTASGKDKYQVQFATIGAGNGTLYFREQMNGTWSAWNQLSGGGGGGTPGGASGNVQFNSSSNFGGDNAFFWDNSNKRLGIGTASPLRNLHITGTGAEASIVLTRSDGLANNKNWRIFTQNSGAGTAGSLHIDLLNDAGTAPTTSVMTMLNSGNVGIGTAIPGSLLHLSANSSAAHVAQRIENQASNGYSTLWLGGLNNGFLVGGTTAAAWTRQLVVVTPDSATPIVLAPAAVERMRVDGSGNVGIGTASPSVKLHVVETTANTDGRVTITGTGDINAAGMRLADSDSGKLWDTTIRANSNGDLWFSGYDGSTWRTPMVLAQTGNVGIGIGTPTSKLHVYDSLNAGVVTATQNGHAGASAYTQNAIYSNNGAIVAQIGSTANGGTGYFYYTGTSGMNIYTTTATPLNLGTNNNVSRVVIDSAGNVGIGTTSPTAALSIGTATPSVDTGTTDGADNKYLTIAGGGGAGQARGGYIQFHGNENTTNNYNGDIWVTLGNGDGASNKGDFGIYAPASGNAFFVSNAGNVGIGTASPVYKLDVQTATGSAVSGYTTADGMIGVYGRASSTASHAALFHNTGSNYYCYIGYLNTYSIVCSGPSSIPSDERLKRDVTSLQDFEGVDALMRLRPVSYHWKDEKKGNRLEYGFIAQEVEKVLPNLVGTVKPTTDAEKQAAAGGDIKTMQYEGLIAPLVKAVQELKADNDNLRAGLKAANDNEAEGAAAIEDLRREIELLKAAR